MSLAWLAKSAMETPLVVLLQQHQQCQLSFKSMTW
jgi:hypothetical protein